MVLVAGRGTHLVRGVAAAVALLAAAVAAEAQDAPLAPASWLAGCWESRQGERVMHETWMSAVGDLMVGSNRTLVSGTARAWEHLRIRAYGDSLVYTAIPSGQVETDFALSDHEHGRLRFENPTHDFPQRIEYVRVGADSLAVQVSAVREDGRRGGFELRFGRVACG